MDWKEAMERVRRAVKELDEDDLAAVVRGLGKLMCVMAQGNATGELDARAKCDVCGTLGPVKGGRCFQCFSEPSKMP